jgi:hypothetical protein
MSTGTVMVPAMGSFAVTTIPGRGPPTIFTFVFGAGLGSLAWAVQNPAAKRMPMTNPSTKATNAIACDGPRSSLIAVKALRRARYLTIWRSSFACILENDGIRQLFRNDIACANDMRMGLKLFRPAIVFNGVGKCVAEHITKGAMVMVTGRIHFTRWTDSEGQTRCGCEIIAEQVDLLAKAKEATSDEPKKRRSE